MLEVEKRRCKTRICNYILFAYFGVYTYFFGANTDARKQIKKVVSHKEHPNGLKQEKVVSDMEHID